MVDCGEFTLYCMLFSSACIGFLFFLTINFFVVLMLYQVFNINIIVLIVCSIILWFCICGCAILGGTIRHEKKTYAIFEVNV